MIADVWSPGVAIIALDFLHCPLGRFGKDAWLLTPVAQVGAGEYAYAHAGGEEVVTAILAASHHGIMDVGVCAVELWPLLG